MGLVGRGEWGETKVVVHGGGGEGCVPELGGELGGMAFLDRCLGETSVIACSYSLYGTAVTAEIE